MRISDWSSDVCSSDLRCDRVSHRSHFQIGSIMGGDGQGGPRALIFCNRLTQLLVELVPVPGIAFTESYIAGRRLVHVQHGRRHLLGHDDRHHVPHDRVVPELEEDDMERDTADRSEEHTSELQSLMRISYAVFCLK